MTRLDETHDPARTSWVASANVAGTEFPIQNLPLGVFSPPGAGPRGGIAIGDEILDLAAAVEAGLFEGTVAEIAQAAAAPTLNHLLSLGTAARVSLRRSLSSLLDSAAPPQPDLLHRAAACRLHLPVAVPNYTDFYAGIHHATTVGTLMRPENPLLPNYKYVPIGYHGRASSVRPSGVALRRPNGQRKGPADAEPTYGPSRNLDYELELGLFIGAGNELGEPIPIGQAADHIAGFCLLNDWSARDIQGWEYQPLGPFLAKSFGTTISPWIVTPEALAPFRMAQPTRPDGDPAPLPYLYDAQDQASGALDLKFEVLIETAAMRVAGAAPHLLSTSRASDLYWTVAQLVAHHSANGCDLRPGDLLGSGTISGPTPDGAASLLELSWRGTKPITLPNGETRRFLEDGDAIILRGRASRDGAVSIGFGACRAEILPAVAV